MNSTPNTTYRLEFFANTACDPSGNGEGASYLGSQDVVTDANGNASFSAILPAGISGGTPVSATATDPGGNTSEFSSCRESTSGAYNWHYQYDARYRLTGAYYSDGTYFRYTYDAYFAEGKSGNRLSEETVTGTITYTYDSADRLASVDGVPYTWDNVFAAGKPGNLLSDGVYTYTFNHANQLVGVSGAGPTVSYGYNGQGDRVSQTVGITTTTYTLDLVAGLTQVLSDGTDTYLYGAGRIAQYDTSGAQYFLGDALGSVRQLVDANGEVLLAQSYEPYGDVLESAGEGTSSYGFAAEMRDPTGLIYLRARYLDTSQGRFISKDTWPGDYNRPLSLNGWNYVEADPINATDPSGRCLDEDMDGKCDPGWQCASISDPIAREACWQAHCESSYCFNPEYTLPITDWGKHENQSDASREHRSEIVLGWLKTYCGSGAWWKSGDSLDVTKIKAWILDGEAGELWNVKNYGKLPNPVDLKAEKINDKLKGGLIPIDLAYFTFFFNPINQPPYPEGLEFNDRDWARIMVPPKGVAIEKILTNTRPPRIKRWWRHGEPGTENRNPLFTYTLPNGILYHFD